ncbi:Dabb family protein [Anaerorhabdus sp.]|uniref:Dabb family protein n=1 Tax=Anaerorhabdus sp. TaxID=1872524 RepID=UPI002FC5BB60
MIKHIVLWRIKESYTNEEKEVIKNNAKKHLESLINQIPHVAKLELIINTLDSSNVDMCLNSEFETEDMLIAYANHSLHKEVASTYIIPFVESRSCIDYIK